MAKTSNMCTWLDKVLKGLCQTTSPCRVDNVIYRRRRKPKENGIINCIGIKREE